MATKDWKKTSGRYTTTGIAYKRVDKNEVLTLEEFTYSNKKSDWFFGTGAHKFTSKKYKSKAAAIRAMKAYMRKH